MQRDEPAIAESIVKHAEVLCERESHFWDVIRELSIPSDALTDTRRQSQIEYRTDEMVRAHIYRLTRGLSQSKFAAQLHQYPSIFKACRFHTSSLADAPSQQDLSYAKTRFSEDTWDIIRAVAEGLKPLVVEHEILAESLVAAPADELDAEVKTELSTTEAKRKKSTQTIRLARRHAIPEFDTRRAEHRVYSDEEIWDMLARICHNTGSAHSEAEYGWLTDDDVTCADSTFLRALKKTATPAELDSQLTLDDFRDPDAMPKVDWIRDEVLEKFDAATASILNSIRGESVGDIFDERTTRVAIDFTHEQVFVYPWEDKEEGIAKSDFPPMVSGYYDKSDQEYKFVYKYATITLVGQHPPIILGVEPVKENSKWEIGDSPSYSKGDIVARLLDRAQRFIDIDEVLMDRGFYTKESYAAVDDRGLTYITPVPKYEDDFRAIKNIEEHPTADAAVNHDIPLAIDGEVHHTREYLYVPSRNTDEDGKYAVFVTNKDHVEPEEIDHVTGIYNRRWDIESQYKSIKDFLPKTSSMDYRIRLGKFVFAALIYNLWRLTDYLIKISIGADVRSPPELTAKTFVRALGAFLRDIG